MSGSHDIDPVNGKRIAWVLWAVLLINAAMFVVEFSYGLASRSNALIADSLDMLADAFVYAVTLWALTGTHQTKSQVALGKGVVMGALGLFVLYEVIQKILNPILPEATTITVVGAIALVANVICVLLLLRFRDNELNIKSAWVCSRNDALTSGSVIVAGLLVGHFQSMWPDIIVGLGIVFLVFSSSFNIVKESLPHVGRHDH